MAAALELTGVKKRFGSFAALDDARLTVAEGEVHALLGENGAGKSSLMNVAAGLYAPDDGEIRIRGESVRLAGPRDAIRHGIGMIHQHFKLVRRFSVLENIMLANPGGRYGQDRVALERRIRETAGQLGFALDPHRRVDRLSIAEQQRAEIVKVLITGARILILDEPTAVLTDDEAGRLLAAIRAIAQGGAAVVLVTHKLRDVLAFADRVTVMRAGRTVATVDPRESTTDALTTLVVGSAIVQPARKPRPVGASRLRVSSLKANSDEGHRALDGLSFEVHAGEIYGIAGVGGNGQTELAETLVGGRRPVSGAIGMSDSSGALYEVSGASPRARLADGLASIPADRASFALASSVSVAENYAIAHVEGGRFGPFAWVRRAAMRREASEAVRRFDVQGLRGLDMRAGLLSGGNAQKLVLAREFSRGPSIIVAHSPSRGLDVRACAAVHGRLLEARENGVAVVLISEDLDEILALSDRIGVMNRGRIVAEFRSPADRQAVGQAMVGHV